MTMEEQPVSLTNSPRPFSEIPALWLRLGQMTEAFFAAEYPRTSAANTIFGVLAYTAISTTLAVIQSLLGGIINYATAPSAAQGTQFATIYGTSIVFVCCFGLIVTPIGFYLNNGITYIGALIFGGKGSYNSQAYLSSLFLAPLGFISSLASFISLVPVVGSFIFFAVLCGVIVFNLILTIRVFKVVHDLSAGRAAAAVLLPMAFILVPICIIAVLMLMGPAIGNVFSDINAQLGTPMP